MNPFELADYLAFVAALLLGYTVGRRRTPRPPKPLKPICSCGHGLGSHENGMGRCHASSVVTLHSYKTYGGTDNQDQILDCACMHYDGPDKLLTG